MIQTAIYPKSIPLFPEIPPTYRVSGVMGFHTGKSSLMRFRTMNACKLNSASETFGAGDLGYSSGESMKKIRETCQNTPGRVYFLHGCVPVRHIRKYFFALRPCRCKTHIASVFLYFLNKLPADCKRGERRALSWRQGQKRPRQLSSNPYFPLCAADNTKAAQPPTRDIFMRPDTAFRCSDAIRRGILIFCQNNGV